MRISDWSSDVCSSDLTPLGIILTIMMGAAVAERSGLFFALIRGSLRGTPRRYMTPIIAVVGMVSHHAADAAYVVLIPMAAVLFASELGRASCRERVCQYV